AGKRQRLAEQPRPAASLGFALAAILFERVKFHASLFNTLSDDAEAATDFLKSREGAIKVVARVGGGNLRTQARLALRHDRIPQALDVNAFAEQLTAHVLRDRCFAEHHRHNRVAAFDDRETKIDDFAAKIFG